MNLLTIKNGADLDAARVGFHAAFLSALESNKADGTEVLYTEVPSSAGVEEWDWLGDLPGFEEWKGERKMSGLEAFKLRIVNKDWASGIHVHQNEIKDDKLGLIGPRIAGLAQKAFRHRFDLMVKLLVNGFDGLAYPETGNGLAYDGAFFFSTSHAGGSNKLTSALDATSLAAAELLLESMTTLDGSDPIDTYGTHLIVGPKLRTTAEKLLQQERLANGEDNINKGKYKLVVSPRLRGTYDDYWFLADCSGPIKPCIFQMREEISTSAIVGNQGGSNDSESRFSRGRLKFGAEARYNVGYFEPRMIVGSAL